MPILLVCATALELSAALERRVEASQGRVFPAQAHGREVLALVTGLGVINASLALGRALGGQGGNGHIAGPIAGPIDGVLNLGVAGSFDLAAHPLGAVRLVDQELWPEYGLLASGAHCADARALGFALCGAGRDAIFDRLALDARAGLAAMGLVDTGWDTAASLTVSGVTADQARADALFKGFGAGLENMEGFALAYGAKLAGLPFAELRAVSNAVGSRPPKAWDLPGALASLGRAARRLLAPLA